MMLYKISYFCLATALSVTTLTISSLGQAAKNKTSEEWEKFVAVAFDEMKIKEAIA